MRSKKLESPVIDEKLRDMEDVSEAGKKTASRKRAQSRFRYLPDTARPFIDTPLPCTEKPENFYTAVRLKSKESLEAKGLPTPKLERWKYTDIRKGLNGMKAEYGEHLWTSSDRRARVIAPEDIGGYWTDILCRELLATEKYGDSMLADLAAAYTGNLRVIDVPEQGDFRENNGYSRQDSGRSSESGDVASVGPDLPLIVDLTGRDGLWGCERLLMRVGKNKKFTLIERHNGSGTYWKNNLSQIVLEPGADLLHIRIQEDASDSVATNYSEIMISEGAHYRALTFQTGGHIVRNQVHAVLEGEGAVCSLSGAMLLSGKQTGDNTITIEHKAHGGSSSQYFRTLLSDQAHGVFQGKVHVHQNAQKTDGYQLSNTLMLSERARMETKPELEIYADDVKCSHGATTGHVDEEPLFYMRARGMEEAQAKRLLLQSFIQEIFMQEKLDLAVSMSKNACKPEERNKITDFADERTVREMLEEKVTCWLSENLPLSPGN